VQVSGVAAYLRLSLDWEGKGLGVERQREDCLRIAGRLGVEITDWYVDNSVGASQGSGVLS
jgi:site-specific DNA recombinase